MLRGARGLPLPAPRRGMFVADAHVAFVQAQGFRRLGLQGHSVVQAYAQISSVLRSRLGREHALFLARPEIDPRSGAIDWYSPRPAPIVRRADLNDGERAALDAKADAIRGAILALAHSLRSEGESAQLMASILEAAVQTPEGEWLYAAAGEPLLVMWGHANDGATAARERATEPTALSLTATDSPTAEPVPSVSPKTPRLAVQRGRWWFGLLPLLLLLLLLPFLGPRGCIPGPLLAMVPDRPTEDELIPGPSTDPVAQAEARRRALERELDALERQRAMDASGVCVPVERRDFADGEPERPRIPERTERTDRLRRASPSGAVDDDRPLEIPENPTARKQPDFLNGHWRVKGTMKETRSDVREPIPVEVGFEFDKDGKGEMILRRINDGSTCRGPATGTMQDGRLRIVSQANLRCDRGPDVPGQRIECRRSRDGRTLCNGVNPSGATYAMEIVRGPQMPDAGQRETRQ